MIDIENLLRIDYWQARQLMALINWTICTVIGWACVCRISVTSTDTTRHLTRWSYVALLVGATASGFGPLLDYWAGPPQLLLNAAVLLLLLDGVRHWRRGVPIDARRERRKQTRYEMKKDTL